MKENEQTENPEPAKSKRNARSYQGQADPAGDSGGKVYQAAVQRPGDVAKRAEGKKYQKAV